MSIKTTILEDLTALIGEEYGIIPDEARRKLAQVQMAIASAMIDLPQVTLGEILAVDAYDRGGEVNFAASSRKHDEMPIVGIEPLVAPGVGAGWRPRVGLAFHRARGNNRHIAMSPTMWRYGMALLQAQIALVERETAQMVALWTR